MSLDWDISKVEDHKSLHIPQFDKNGQPDGFELDPVTRTLVWATVFVGLGEITEKNVDEFAARYELWQDVVGAPLQRIDPETKEIVDHRVTHADIVRHIGLKTNVSRESWSTFLTKLKRHAIDRVKQIRQAAKRAAIEALPGPDAEQTAMLTQAIGHPPVNGV